MKVNRFVGRWLTVLSLFAVNQALAADITQCPNLAEQLMYRVKAVNPAEQIDENASMLMRALGGQTETTSLTDQQQRDLHSANQILGNVASSAVIIDGLVQWVESRAEAELRLWVVGALRRNICDASAAPFFPSTCGSLSTFDAISASLSQHVLVNALRRDLRNMPACALLRYTANPLGYRLQSVYEQYREGASIEHLLYGLAIDSQLNLDQHQSPICRFNDDGSLSDGCGLIIPLLAYAAMLDALPYWRSGDQADDIDINHLPDNPREAGFLAFSQFFSGYLRTAKLQGFADNYLRHLEGNYTEYFTGFDRDMQVFDSLRVYLNEQINVLNQMPDTEGKQQQLEAKLEKISATTLALFTAARKAAFIEERVGWAAHVRQTEDWVHALFNAHNAMAADSFSEALTALQPLVNCLTESKVSRHCLGVEVTDTEAQETLKWLNSGLRTAALLADADNSEEFAETLDSLASPVGAYQLRHQDTMWSLNAYLGVEYGHYTLNVPDYGKLTYDSGEVFAPIGVTWTYPDCGLLGACGVHAQLLNLGVLAGDYEGRIDYVDGVITSDTSSSFRSVITPGVYFVSSPVRNAPFTWGAGMSWGPVEYKTAERLDGTTVPVERERQVGIFVAVDLVIFRFGN